MDSQQPAWRVFDAPPAGPTTSGSAGPGDAAGRAPQPDAGPADLSRLPGSPLLLGGVVIAAAGAIVAVVLAVGGLGGGITLDAAAGQPFGSGAAGPSGEAGSIVVDVAGAVARPGVYHLPAGSRVGDAIAAAGGFGPRVAAARVDVELNLAALLHDGERVVVPSRDGPSSGGPGGGTGSEKPAASSATAGLVDLNTATQAELEALPGIGPVTAGKIIAARAEAPFKTVDDLRERGLVGQKTFDAIHDLITVG